MYVSIMLVYWLCTGRHFCLLYYEINSWNSCNRKKCMIYNTLLAVVFSTRHFDYKTQRLTTIISNFFSRWNLMGVRYCCNLFSHTCLRISHLLSNCAIHGVTQSFSKSLLTSYLEDNVYIICFLRWVNVFECFYDMVIFSQGTKISSYINVFFPMV